MDKIKNTLGQSLPVLIFQPSNKILLSIIAADWMTGFTVGPLYSIQLLNNQFREDCFLHRFRRVCGVFFMGASLCSIFFLTIDRSLRLVKKLNTYTLKVNITQGEGRNSKVETLNVTWTLRNPFCVAVINKLFKFSKNWPCPT